MNNSPLWSQYENRLSRVCDYIHENLDEKLDMDNLAAIACLSPWHWHRIYRAVYGETITATIKRLRMHRAANELVQTELSINIIAERAGYPNLQSFNRTFKKVYGLPPGQYRKTGGNGTILCDKAREKEEMFQVEIKELKPVKIAGLSHIGSYSGVGQAFEKLNTLAVSRGLYGPHTRIIGIYYDDPSIVAEDELRSFAGLSIASHATINAPLQHVRIAGGKYAIFPFQGPYSNMESCYQWIYGTWLKTAECELRDAPGFAEYINPTEKIPGKMVTHIHIPLA